MRFFLVRVIVFTILFTLILLLLSWIAPTWTGNVINNVTSRLPGVEKKLTVSDITDGTKKTITTEEDVVVHDTETPGNESNNNTKEVEVTEEVVKGETIIDTTETPTIAITKDKQTKEDDKSNTIGEIDNILGIDNNETVVIEKTTTPESTTTSEPVSKKPTTTKTPTTLTNDDLSILRELEKNTQ